MGTKKLSGFTIVELLIVIVVIGILAAITIVTYNGIQQRAENVKTIAAVKALKTAMMSYAIEHGSYPITSSACFGDGYPDSDGNGIGDCGTNNGVVTYQKNSIMDNALKSYGGSGTPSVKQYSSGGWMQMGVMFEYVSVYTLDGVIHPWWITYEIGGSNEKCTTAAGGLAGAGTFTSTPPVGWSGASENWSNGIKCWVPLPDPAKS